LTVGRLTTAGPTGTVDLGNIGVVASGGEGCIGTSLLWRDSAGVLTGATIGNASMSCAHPTFRAEAIKYTSPTFAGFTFNASAGEATKVERPLENYNTDESSGKGPIGMNYGMDLRYAGEFNGLRIAATLGYERSDRNNDDSGNVNNSVYSSWGGALSLLHVPTGLFLQAEYIEARNTATNNGLTTAGVVVVQGTGDALGGEATANRWHLQGGTSLYAEYGVHRGFLGLNGFNNNVTAIAGLGSTAGLASGTSSDKMSIWGVGMVQSIDAAAMDLYIGYRNYSLTGVTPTAGSIKDIDVLTAGARIRF
jgi:predicted porin